MPRLSSRLQTASCRCTAVLGRKSMQERRNLAARAGRWSAAHWKTATLVWLAFVVVAVGVGRAVGTVKLTDSEQGTGETARAQAILANAGFKTPASENVLIESK